ncbi:MAG: NTP transferase domain-containing protein [Candidatus Aminicenantes bacterium]|nr:NTP transferase domain-containing protein [Candidatus Aminicenantes bacterium]
MNRKIKAVVLAAGKSKRMKSDRSKVVHKILGKEIINYILDSLSETGIKDEDIIVVVGDNKKEVESVVERNVNYVIQKEQLGTAHALMAAEDHLHDFDGDLLVTVGDNPYITSVEFQKMIRYNSENGLKCTLLSALFPSEPPPYGRIIRDINGKVGAIIEAPDADEEQIKIKEVNAGIYVFDNMTVFPLLKDISSNNEKKEFYLTDIIFILKSEGHLPDAVITENYFAAIGINNRLELAEAQAKFNRDNIRDLSEKSGVTILQPETVTIEYGVEIGKDTIIFPSTYIGSGTKIGSDCRIGPFAYIRNIVIGDGEEVSHQKLTG